MQNSGHGGPHTTPFMTIFGIFVNPPSPNIEKFQLYEVYKSREVSHAPPPLDPPKLIILFILMQLC